jgi:hypothetical protein
MFLPSIFQLHRWVQEGIDREPAPGWVAAKALGVTSGLRVQPSDILRVDEFADRFRQDPVASQPAEFSHRLLGAAGADGP